MKNFRIPPISTLIGSNLLNYLKVIGQGKVDSGHFLKLVLSTLVVIIAIPFHIWESLRFGGRVKKQKLEKEPLFIIGHWRSGTTFLHNVLCRDPEAGYLTTYQSVFPNNLASKAIFKTFMKWSMPSKRPSDNVELHIDYPQEDEFALSNSYPDAYYNFFYFPENYPIYLNKLLEGPDEKWFSVFDRILKKALYNTRGKRAIIKNPVHTFRVKALLKLYPRAKFIFIYRNPVTVFLSSYSFFTKLMPTLYFHSFSEDEIEEMIITVYKKMMQAYEESKSLIPAENLMEIRFEEFEADPMAKLEEIYRDLLKDDFNKPRQELKNYLESLKSYKRNAYEVEQKKIELVKKEWGASMEKWNYTVPSDLVLI